MFEGLSKACGCNCRTTFPECENFSTGSVFYELSGVLDQTSELLAQSRCISLRTGRNLRAALETKFLVVSGSVHPYSRCLVLGLLVAFTKTAIYSHAIALALSDRVFR